MWTPTLSFKRRIIKSCWRLLRFKRDFLSVIIYKVRFTQSQINSKECSEADLLQNLRLEYPAFVGLAYITYYDKSLISTMSYTKTYYSTPETNGLFVMSYAIGGSCLCVWQFIITISVDYWFEKSKCVFMF